MLNQNPALKFVWGEWMVEVFENITPHEPHICIYKAGKVPPLPVEWAPVKKIFLQMKAEGFFDKYNGWKVWVGYPKKSSDGISSKFDFVTVEMSDGGHGCGDECGDNGDDDDDEFGCT